MPFILLITIMIEFVRLQKFSMSYFYTYLGYNSILGFLRIIFTQDIVERYLPFN